MTAEEALRVAAEEGIELETSDRLSVTGYVGVFLNHPGNRRQFQLQMSGSGSARQCVGSFSSAEAAALCKARIELEPDGLTHVIVRKVLGKLVETTARAVEHEQAEEHWREAAAAAKEERRQARERQTAAREAREAEAAAAEAKKAEAIVTRCLHREIRLLAEELSLSDHTLQLALERSDVLVEVHALHTECAACRSKWAGITRAIDKQPNLQAWTLGLHALRVAGACIVYAQREAPEHAHDVASKRFQRMAEAASAVMAAEGRPKDSTRKSDLPLEALWLIDRGMERRLGREITFRCGAVAAPPPERESSTSSSASTTYASGSTSLDGVEMRHRAATGMTVEQVYAAAEAEGLVLLRDDGNKTGFMNVSKDRSTWSNPFKGQIDGRHIGVFPTAEEAALAVARARAAANNTPEAAPVQSGGDDDEPARKRARIAAKLEKASMEGRFPAEREAMEAAIKRKAAGGSAEVASPRRPAAPVAVASPRVPSAGADVPLHHVRVAADAQPAAAAAAASVVTEAEIVSHLHAAGELPIKRLIHHFKAAIGTGEEAQREFMDKVAAVAESRQVEERGKTRTYIVLKAETIDRYQLREAPDLSPDVHFSDVHLRGAPATAEADAVTVFEYRPAAEAEVEDDDGDLCPQRRGGGAPHADGGVLRLRHAVGRRSIAGCRCGAARLPGRLSARGAWGGGATVLELGAGVGLSGLVAARAGAARVFITDAPAAVLYNARHNASEIHHWETGAVAVRRLDWHHPDASLVESRNPSDPFGWSAAELAELSRCTLILCADCIYDAAATDALLALLAPLLAALPPAAAALFAIERRLNFDAGGLTTRARAEERFLSRLGEMGCFEWRRVAPTFAQRFEYERVKELVLWRVSLSPDADVEPLAAIDRAGAPAKVVAAAAAEAVAAAGGSRLRRSERSAAGGRHGRAMRAKGRRGRRRFGAWNQQRGYLGYFPTAEEAALAVARAGRTREYR